MSRLIMKSLANEFFSTMAAGAEAHHSEHADQYELLVNGIKDESDLGRQVAFVDEMVAAGVDAIVIAPADSKALVPALRKAMKAGVVVVNIDNRLDSESLTSGKRHHSVRRTRQQGRSEKGRRFLGRARLPRETKSRCWKERRPLSMASSAASVSRRR